MAGRFSCLVIALLMLILWGSIGSADFKTRDDANLHILSYQNMLKLPVGIRASYIRSLRAFMIREEQKYPTNWDAAKKSASALVPGIDNVLWSTAQADSPSLQDIDAAYGNAVQQYWAEQEAKIFGSPPSANGARPVTSSTQLAADDAPDTDSGATAVPDNSDQLPQIIKAIKNTEDYACQLEATCYFAGNRSTRMANCVCAASHIQDRVAKADTISCGSGSVACNRMLFGAKDDGSAFCAPRGSNATSYCDEPGHSQSAEEVAANFAKEHPKDWDEQRKQVEAYCNKYRNADCRVLQKRLSATVANSPQGPHVRPLCSFFVADPKDDTKGVEAFVVGSSSDPSVEDPKNTNANNLSQYTSINIKMKPATRNQKEQCERQNHAKDPLCYGDGDYQDFPTLRVLGTDAASNTISITHVDKIGDKIHVAPDTGKCAPAADEAPPIKVEGNKSDCPGGEMFCSAQETTQKCDPNKSGTRNLVLSVTGKGEVFVKHLVHSPDGSSHYEKLPADTNVPGTTSVDRDVARTAAASGRDYADAVNWAKESARTHKGDVATELTSFTDIKDPNDLRVYLGPNTDFGDKVMGSMDPKNCPSNRWVAIGKPVPGWHGVVGTWSGADETIFIACADLKLKAAPDKKSMINTADKLKNRSYMKIHMDHNSGKVLAAETGTMNGDGRPHSAEVFRPGEVEPYLKIDHTVAGDHLFSDSYNVAVNECPFQDRANPFPLTYVVKTTWQGKSSYVACHAAEDVKNGYVIWTMLLNEKDGVLAGHSDDSQGGTRFASFEFSVDHDKYAKTTPPTCKVRKKADDKLTFEDVEVSPLDPNTTGRRQVPVGAPLDGTH